MGGGGSGGGTTQQQNQYSSLSPWAAPYVTSMLGAAQSQVFNVDPTSGNITGINPYNAFGSYNPNTGGQYGMTPSNVLAAQSSVAGFSPLQNQAFQTAANLQTPGQFGQATGLNVAGALNTLGTAGQAAQAGQQYQNMATNPAAMQAYMNPYVQQSLNPQLELLSQQTGAGVMGTQAGATQAGAFGGTRQALQSALAQQAGNLAAQQAIGQGYNQAYQQAQQAQQYGAGLGLQGLQAALGGYGQAGTLGANLANIGTGQLAAQQGILGTQSTLGAQQQAQQQNIINQAMQNYATAMQYPMTQLTNLKNLAMGIPMTDTTTTVQQPPPSLASSVAGLGTAGIGGLAMYNALNKGS